MNNKNIDSQMTNNSKVTKRIGNKRKIIIITIIAVCFIFIGSMISIVKLHAINPFASGIGLVRILFTDTEYVEIQNSPKIMLAKPEDAWESFMTSMEASGFKYLENERMGRICVFEQDGKKYHVFFSSNGYYSKWEFEK